jgi:hypothetical protein
MSTTRFRAAKAKVAAILLGGVALVALWTLARAPWPTAWQTDERDYLRAAVHLARAGVLSHAPISDPSPARDAYREPGYPFVLSAVWRATGAEPPGSDEAFGEASTPRAARAARGLGVALLLIAAAAAAAAARYAGAGTIAAAGAGVLALASPALRAAAATLASESLAAALVAVTGAALGAAVGGRAGAVAVAGLAAGLAPLARGSALALAPAGLLLLLLAPRDLAPRRRAGRALLFALLAVVPAGAWALRNRAATGHAVLSDRSGVVLWVRAELDRELAREGLAPALLEWTPLDAARAARERHYPESRLARYEWSGEGNFFTRSLRRWQAERAASGDSLAADAALGRAALSEFARAPGAHLRATVAVAWRGLFAERSPPALAPLDLGFALGLLLAGACLTLAWSGMRGRRPAAIALLVPVAALFLFHALATEFLPRFGVPALPLAWAALVAAIAGRPRGEAEGPAAASPGAV